MSTAVRNKDGIFINIEVFKEEAKYFDKHGTYQGGPPNPDPMSEYHQYWSEQNRRCIYGHEVGGVRITGDHYNYLNFNQIRLKENTEQDISNVSKRYRKRAAKKKIFFPDFWDGDYDYFHTLEIAEKGIPDIYNISWDDPDIDDKVHDAYKALRLGVNIHIDDLAGGFHVMVAKARRKGFSFKNGSLLVNRYKRVPNFIGVLAAYEKKYITPEGTMDMCNNFIDFINQHTAWQRNKTKDSILHQKDAYEEVISGVNVEKGFKSQIIGITCKDNPSAIRGKDPTMAMMEECGTWPNLNETLAATLPSLGAGAYTTGLLVAFGTGSAEADEWQGFEDNFYDPAGNNFVRLENQWDDSAAGTFCSFYFPDKKNKEGFYDKNGNSDLEGAFKYEQQLKAELSKNSANQKKIQLRTIEHANKPSETFSSISGNFFPTEELREVRRKLLSRAGSIGVPGKIEGTIGGETTFYPDVELTPVLRYPHKKGEDITGCIMQYFPPYKVDGVVPPNLYTICHDPFATDKDDVNLKGERKEFSDSLGATYVIMQPNRIVPGMQQGDIIVAEYVGAGSLDEHNKNLYLLATHYNAMIGFENDRGDVVGFAKRNREAFIYLEPEFKLGWTDGMNNNLGRSYGMSVAGGKDNKKVLQGNTFIDQWLRKKRGITIEGKEIKNLNVIPSIGLLDELIKFNLKGNFDRVSALRIGMYHQNELLYNDVKAATGGNDSSVSKFFKSKMYA